MYEALMHPLRAFMGTGTLRTSLTIAIAIIVTVIAAGLCPAFRSYATDLRSRTGWRAGVGQLMTGVYKFLVIFVVLRLLTSVLTFQAQLFGNEHGRVTSSNRSAVLMKWGYPHEQRELVVRHTRKRAWMTRQLLLPPPEKKKKGQITSESFWKDLETPVQAIRGELPTVISVKEEMKDVPVEQRSIVSADVDIRIRNNPRRLGNANYAGYEDAWTLAYVIQNRSEWETTASLSFPLPAKTGLFDEMVLRVDGVNALETARTIDNAVNWRMEMQPGDTAKVSIGYKSRGLEHLRYIPKRMTQTGHYRVSITVDGIPAEKLDYPIGSMPPREDLARMTGDSYSLTWSLDNALTSYDIGIKLPDAEQPDYHFARLLRQAPFGLILLIVMLTMPRLIIREPVSLLVVLLTGFTYCLHYTFMGRLADLFHGFAAPFAISAVTLIGLVTCYRIRDRESRLRVHDAIVFAIALIGYPLVIVHEDMTRLWMHIIYLAMLIQFCGLLLMNRMRTGSDAPPKPVPVST